MMTKNLWTSLDSLSSQAGVLADWQREMGADFDAARGYLRPTGEASTSFPCTHRPPCGCYHEVNPHAQGDLVAACRCADGDCPPIRLEPADLIIQALNTRKLGDSIRVALGFEPAPTGTAHDSRKSVRIGTYGALHTPVFFYCPHDEAALLEEIADLWNPGAVPFILLTPTRNCYTARVEAAIHRSSSLLISCSAALAMEAGGKLRVIRPVGPLLQDFVNRRAEGTALAKTVETFGRDFHAVATNTNDLTKQTALIIEKIEAQPMKTAALLRGTIKQRLGTLGTVVEADFTASPHFTNLMWRGNQYVLRRTAAVIIEALYIAQKNYGIPGFRQDEVFGQVYGSNKQNWPSSHARIQNFFRTGDAKRLWDDGLIGHDGKGNFHLNLKIHTSTQ